MIHKKASKIMKNGNYAEWLIHKQKYPDYYEKFNK